MAEVIQIPTPGNNPRSSLSRETSSLRDGGIKEEKKSIEKLQLKGTVVEKKPSFIERFKDTFIAEDARDVGDYIIWDILIPTIKRTIRDIIVGSADRVFLGTSSSHNNTTLYRERGVTHVRTDYGSASRNRVVTRTSVDSRPIIPTVRSTFKLNDIVFEQYDDAANVLARLVDYVDSYGKVSVDDYFDLIDHTSDYTAQNWGWTDLTSATIVNVSNGYLIKLPNPVVIKN